jgi:tripeptidyl-peptidase-2
MPKEAKYGDYLVGKMDVLPKDTKLSLFGISYAVPMEMKEKEKSKDSVKTEEEVKKKNDSAALKESVRDMEIEFVSKMEEPKEQDELLKRLEAEHPKHVALFVAKLKVLLARFEKVSFWR